MTPQEKREQEYQKRERLGFAAIILNGFLSGATFPNERQDQLVKKAIEFANELISQNDARPL